MEKKYISISKGQYLSDIDFHIERNTILVKTLPGLGATYTEIKEPRNSIIIEPNTPPIKGKASSSVHKTDNIFPVIKDVKVDKIVEYLETTINRQKEGKSIWINIMTTPESFPKVKEAFDIVGFSMYANCFLLFDECHKAIQDVDYRQSITIPFEDFFQFSNKALVSATPIIPTDPRFRNNGFKIVEIKPNFEYTKEVILVKTNNTLEAIRGHLIELETKSKGKQPVCIFVNKTDFCLQYIEKLDLGDEATVFCSKKSVDSLKERGLKRAYEDWDIKHKSKYMFFTSRFYAALDIILDEEPIVIFVSEPYMVDYTMVDPNTDMVQALGRFRNGYSMCIHISSFNNNFEIRSKREIITYLQGLRYAYSMIKNLYECANSKEARRAYHDALDILSYKSFVREGRTDYFAIDQYIDNELLKSSYHNEEQLINRYNESTHFKLNPTIHSCYRKFSDYDRISILNPKTPLKDKRRIIVSILEDLKNDQTEYARILRKNIIEVDPFIVKAFDTVGKDVIESKNYNASKIKEAMIIKRHNDGLTNTAVIELIKNSFPIGKTFTLSHIKKELNRIFRLFDIMPPEAITAVSISKYFIVDKCKVNGNRAYRILRSKI